MSMKTIFLALCVALTLLAGCGRSKPQSSKTGQADSAAAEETTPAALPPDQQPPKPIAGPVRAPAPTVARTANTVPFAPLAPGQDPVGDAEHQKFQEIAAKQADAVRREQEQRRIQLQNQPEENKGE